MQFPLSKQRILQLSLVFGLIYFFSPNGMAQLPSITISFLMKNVLGLTATQASYLGAITLIGWAIKPLWGIISDFFPILGYRRKSYLIVTTLLAAGVWLSLGQMENYTAQTLLFLFALSSVAYAFMDVICDALMIEQGKPHNLTGRFQSIQWGAVYIASIIAGYAGGWVAQNLKPQDVFSINAVFPLLILVVVFLFVKEERSLHVKEQVRHTFEALKDTFREKRMWLLAFFLFFWTFSPSFGVPFFYYSVDNLKFDQLFFGTVAAVSSACAALAAFLFGKYLHTIKTKPFLRWMIGVGVVATLFDLLYFIPFIKENLALAKTLYLASAAILGLVGTLSFLVILNAAARSCLKYAEGTTFATLTSFWNIGVMLSAVAGGYLFSKMGLPPLILVSAVFTGAAWLLLPFIRFVDD